jgi:hypothetical protein
MNEPTRSWGETGNGSLAGATFDNPTADLAAEAEGENGSAGLDPLRSLGREPRVEAGGAGLIAGVKLKVNQWLGR